MSKKKFTNSGLPERDFKEIYENAKKIEILLQKAKKDKCYVEAMVFVHNSVELYLRRKIIDFILALENKRILDQKKYNLLFSSKNKSVLEYAEICYLFNIIGEKDYDLIIDFNKKRNEAVHRFLKKSISYDDIKEYVKLGETIKLKLSPINHSSENIKKIINNEGCDD